MSLKITPEHQCRTVIVYLRQSTSFQIAHDLESQRRQYGLVDYARQLDFGAVDVIDEDLGRTGSRLVERPTWVPTPGRPDLRRSDRGGVLCRGLAAGPEWARLGSSDRTMRIGRVAGHRS
jgi:hypothetical protein